MFGTKDSYVINLITKNNSKLNIKVSDITRSSSISSGMKLLNKTDIILKARLILQ